MRRSSRPPVDGRGCLLDAAGNLYCGNRDGRILRIAAPGYSKVRFCQDRGGLSARIDREGG